MNNKGKRAERTPFYSRIDNHCCSIKP